MHFNYFHWLVKEGESRNTYRFHALAMVLLIVDRIVHVEPGGLQICTCQIERFPETEIRPMMDAQSESLGSKIDGASQRNIIQKLRNSKNVGKFRSEPEPLEFTHVLNG